tara:strand:- start:9563 stop:10237 length:675 start_codon:yes stop_codon:yes gene_type:complete
MAIRQETQAFDPFAKATPGQSFTDEPGLRPYERPPLETDPEKLYKILDEQLNEESTATKIADILDVGVSAETLSETLMMKCFAEGVCSPDVSEIVKPFIFMSVVEIGTEHSVENMALFNENKEEKGMSPEAKLNLMKKLDSERFDDTMKTFDDMDKNEEEAIGLFNEEMAMQDDEGMEEEGMPMQQPEGEGSFLGMSMSDEMPVESDEETEEMMTMPEEKGELV